MLFLLSTLLFLLYIEADVPYCSVVFMQLVAYVVLKVFNGIAYKEENVDFEIKLVVLVVGDLLQSDDILLTSTFVIVIADQAIMAVWKNYQLATILSTSYDRKNVKIRHER